MLISKISDIRTIFTYQYMIIHWNIYIGRTTINIWTWRRHKDSVGGQTIKALHMSEFGKRGIDSYTPEEEFKCKE